MSHSYPIDISREQFARILPILETARRRTKPRTVDLYDVFCGVLYLLKSGCQWRMLPADFPDWRTCYKYFRQWSERPCPDAETILERVLKNRLATTCSRNFRTNCQMLKAMPTAATRRTAPMKNSRAIKTVSMIVSSSKNRARMPSPMSSPRRKLSLKLFSTWFSRRV